MTPIDPSMTVAQLLDRLPETMRILIDRRMSCIGCSIAPYHTIAEACAEYDLSLEGFMREVSAIAERR